MQESSRSVESGRKELSGPAITVLLAISFSHLLNDTIQAVIPAIYPLLKKTFELTFGQVGLITLTFQLTASLLQPLVGLYADHRPVPYSLTVGMALSLLGITLLSVAGSFPLLLVAAGLVGMGSSIFHPEASRVARLASGGKHGLAQFRSRRCFSSFFCFLSPRERSSAVQWATASVARLLSGFRFLGRRRFHWFCLM